MKVFIYCKITLHVVALTRDMTCTRSCSYSFMYSWWWVR